MTELHPLIIETLQAVADGKVYWGTGDIAIVREEDRLDPLPAIRPSEYENIVVGIHMAGLVSEYRDKEKVVRFKLTDAGEKALKDKSV